MKIFLLDKETLFRDGMRSLLLNADYEVCCLVEDQPLFDQISTCAPDVIFLEPLILSTPPTETLAQLKETVPGVKVVFITSDDKHSHIVEAIQAGADGYLSKNIESVEFFEMIDRLKRDEPAITSGIANVLFKVLRKRPADGLPVLTAIEIQILQRAANGNSNAEIANIMGVSQNTIKFHMKKINSKLRTSNRTEAVMVAMQNGSLKRE